MGTELSTELPAWAEWSRGTAARPFTLGVEEEVMLLEPPGWNLAQAIDEVLPRLPHAMAHQAQSETHAAALELKTGVHRDVAGSVAELRSLRDAMRHTTARMGLSVASAGTHPFAVWRETAVSRGARQEVVYGSMRELARREPTFALHVHVGIDDPEDAICVANRLRVHLPILLALSANSPFWQGRDTGLASARTPLFQAFPRVGIPRAFADYADYVGAVDLLIRCGAFPEPTFLWWDVRPQPRIGTVEVRIMDAQTTLEATSSLVALVQCLARLERLERWVPDKAVANIEALDENRFLAARDGVNMHFIDPAAEQAVPLRDRVSDLLAACRPHAEDLGCEAELGGVSDLLARPAAERQLELGRGPQRLPGLVQSLADAF